MGRTKVGTNKNWSAQEKYEVILEKMVFPEPVISVAVEPKTKADQEKTPKVLMKLAEENRKKVIKHYFIDLKKIVICGNLLSEVMKDEKDKIYFALVFIGSCIY